MGSAPEVFVTVDRAFPDKTAALILAKPTQLSTTQSLVHVLQVVLQEHTLMLFHIPVCRVIALALNVSASRRSAPPVLEASKSSTD